MKLFRKKYKTPTDINPIIFRALTRCKAGMQRLAEWLQRKTIHYSSRKLKLLLLLFCFAFFGESLLLIYYGVNSNQSKYYFVTPIHIVPLLKEKVYQPTISRKEYDRIHAFKKYVDSLQGTSAGKLKSDSLLFNRPYLMDTINLLENIYYEQQANSK